MKIIFVDMTNYKLPMFCEPCAKTHIGLTRISLSEAKGMLPDTPIHCSECDKDLEIEEL